eukprot:208149_1
MYQSAVYGNDQLLLQKDKKESKKQESEFNKCWMDDFYKEIRRGQIKKTKIKKINSYIQAQQFDSDAIYDDISDQKQSNIANLLGDANNDNNELNKVLSVVICETDM